MKTLSLIYDEHRKLPIVAIRFSYDDQLKSNLKQLPIVKWSKTKRCFYIENTLERKKELYAHLKKLAVKIDYSTLQSNSKKNDKNRIVLPVLYQQNKIEIQKFEKWLSQKRLSRNTVKTYVEVTVFFLRYTQLKKVNVYTSKLIEQFNYDFIYCGRKSVSYQNQCINGIKKFYEFKGYLVAEMNIVRPKKEKKLPVVLSTNEIKSILKNTINLKHKALLSLLYSGGLRIGEALNLKAKDVDSKRMLIHVRQSKGKKDRYTLLSTTFLTLLRDYYLVYKPKNYLFEGQNGEKYSNASAQAVLKRALRKSNIQKKVTLHTLRHSFATHLLENGTDIRYIQELLGHNSPKTTMIYTHVTDNSLKKIKNPFDDL